MISNVGNGNNRQLSFSSLNEVEMIPRESSGRKLMANHRKLQQDDNDRRKLALRKEGKA